MFKFLVMVHQIYFYLCRRYYHLLTWRYLWADSRHQTMNIFCIANTLYLLTLLIWPPQQLRQTFTQFLMLYHLSSLDTTIDIILCLVS